MRVTFCGTRGSTPAPGTEFVRYGGNTSCVAVAHDDHSGPSLLLDAGTGLRRVQELLGDRAFQGSLLLTHLHWDHVQGLPFFPSGDREGSRVSLFLPSVDQVGPAELLSRMMSPPFFPIGPSQLRGDWTFGYVPDGAFEVEGFSVVARDVPHKGGHTVGYRVSDGRASLAYLPDHCPTAVGTGPEDLGEYHEAALELACGVDLLIHDSHLRAEEVEAEGVFRACGCGVRRSPRRIGGRTTGRAVPSSTRAHGRRSRAHRRSILRKGIGRRCRGGRHDGPTVSTSASRRADATVVGAGPNGLVAAIMLARAGLAVDVYEAAAEPGGGCRTAELTLPGFHHDVCSAVHPLLLASPAFHDIDLSKHGVRLLTPELAFAHPLDGGRGAGVGGTVAEVAASLGDDGRAYARAFSGLVRDIDKILPVFLGTMRSVPRHPVAAGGFGARALTSAQAMARRFHTEEARALDRGGRGALDAATDGASLGCVSPALRRPGAPLRLARRRGRQRSGRRCDGRRADVDGWSDRDQLPGQEPRRPAARRRRSFST